MSAWVTRLRPKSRARMRLFCFPYAGGGASIFRTWSAALPEDIEVCPIQLPGREERLPEQPFTCLATLAPVLAKAVRPYLDLPCVFFGHSMGALVSFELVRYLRRQDAFEPVRLFVSGYRAPQIPDPAPPIHRLPKAAFVERLRRFNGTPKEVLHNAELMQLMLPLLRADFAVCETYAYSNEKPLTCPISTFGGRQDKEVSQAHLTAWRDQTLSSFKLRMLPGNHFFLQSAREALLQAVSEDLSQRW